MSSFELSWGARTDRGLRRAANEDSFLAEQPVFLVADGMGGHEAGAEASRRTIDSYQPLTRASEIDDAALAESFANAKARVGEIAVTHAAAGTTLTGFAMTKRAENWYWLVLNIGDSRVYRFSDGELAQISVDHSAVQELVDDGLLSEVQAESHPDRNIITRAIGAGSQGSPDYWLLPARHGDRMLACSDGLSNELSDTEICRALQDAPTAEAAAERLVKEALQHGGRDNVTAVVVYATWLGADSYEVDATLPTPLRSRNSSGESWSSQHLVDDTTAPRDLQRDEGER